MDVEPAFVADDQSAHSQKPGLGALDHPAMATQPLAAFNALEAMRGSILRWQQALRQRQ